jgi:hypothetical protein
VLKAPASAAACANDDSCSRNSKENRRAASRQDSECTQRRMGVVPLSARGLGCEAMSACRGRYLDKWLRGGARLNEFTWKFQEPRRARKNQVRTRVLSSASEAAASANRAKVGSDPAPILFMIEAPARAGRLSCRRIGAACRSPRTRASTHRNRAIAHRLSYPRDMSAAGPEAQSRRS